MENNDFRERLRGHNVPANPASWTQMEELLDTMPKGETKKKKRPFFWVLLFFGLFAGLILIYTTTIHDKSQNLAELRNQSQQSDDMSLDKSKGLSSVTSKPKQIADENPIADSLNNTAEELNANGAKVKGDQVDVRQDGSSQTEQSTGAMSLSPDVQSSETISQRNSYMEESNSTYGNERDEDNLSSNGNSVNENTTESKLPNEESDRIEGATELPVSSTPDQSTKVEITNRDLIDSLALLRSSHSYLAYENEDLPSPKLTEPILASRFSWFGELGYSSFNGVAGTITRAGIVYDVDRILDLESNIDYTYGNGGLVSGTQEVGSERQFDLNILVHLNFIKNEKNKLSLDLGGGLTLYRGDRVVSLVGPTPTIDQVSTFGPNLQMAISYQRALSDEISLGLRMGFISYDDGVSYISTRFLKRF